MTEGLHYSFLDDNDHKLDILSSSMESSGIPSLIPWDTEIPDSLLDSILTGNDDKMVLDFDGNSSDSELLSPLSTDCSPLDLIGYLSNDNEDDELDEDENDENSFMDVINPSNINNNNDSSLECGKATITLPRNSTQKMSTTSGQNNNHNHNNKTKSTTNNRRISTASSSDSGVEEFRFKASKKYPALSLNSEEKRLCEREGIKLPSHYPLSREEEKNLKRIRRKIRNKESAQHSRRRKKEYVDSMEDRVKNCTDENYNLKNKIELLEKQNKSLASQLKKLHHIILNGGLKQNQTSTAMMVLLLSTAFFLIPGFQKQSSADNKNDLDVSGGLKVSSMTSRSPMLHFPSESSELFSHDIPMMKNEVVVLTSEEEPVVVVSGSSRSLLGKRCLPYRDHDYLSTKKHNNYIEDDVPPRGYGPAMKKTAKLDERRYNVTVGNHGIRRVVLHVPKEFK